MSDFTFLTEGQCFNEDNELDILKKRGRKAAITDFSILLGGLFSDSDHVDNDNSLEGRTGWYWTKSNSGERDASMVTNDGDWSSDSVMTCDSGARPALPFSSISKIPTNGESRKKAKGYSARVRSGFAPYIKYDGVAYDHWITEYYDQMKKRWVLVDADEHCFKHEGKINLNDINRKDFIFGAEAYLGMRNNKYKTEEIYYASDPATLGLKASIRGLFYDFHCLMNNEIIFLHLPKYIQDKKLVLSEKEYKELDELATLMLNSDKNFDELLDIWNKVPKYRIMSGALNT